MEAVGYFSYGDPKKCPSREGQFPDTFLLIKWKWHWFLRVDRCLSFFMKARPLPHNHIRDNSCNVPAAEKVIHC